MLHLEFGRLLDWDRELLILNECLIITRRTPIHSLLQITIISGNNLNRQVCMMAVRLRLFIKHILASNEAVLVTNYIPMALRELIVLILFTQ